MGADDARVDAERVRAVQHTSDGGGVRDELLLAGAPGLTWLRLSSRRHPERHSAKDLREAKRAASPPEILRRVRLRMTTYERSRTSGVADGCATSAHRNSSANARSSANTLFKS